ncbi:uncharacterized protein LOC131720946 [Acipenser ruthenus]|uniref:uncharacterized protein LOC131720946 n=1 Tax=Acipenser ruthenus TaxID=7906 RepID=UPI002740EB34|nr:uncharacterized protein LOC131720946 [Acipenser ruthenus]
MSASCETFPMFLLDGAIPKVSETDSEDDSDSDSNSDTDYEFPEPRTFPISATSFPGPRRVKVTEFRPVIHQEGYTTTYRFSFEKEGRHQCEITNLIFNVALAPAEVEYHTEQWEKCPLHSSFLLPAGPLFDIKCLNGVLKHLSFPHSEYSPELAYSPSTTNPGSTETQPLPNPFRRAEIELVVAHKKNDNIEVIKPIKVTKTHIKIKVKEMSLFGLLRRKKKSKFRALVLLFLSKLVTRKALDVHLLPSNVVLDEVKKKQENGTFLRMPAECVIMEGETYNISCDLEEARVQPKEHVYYRDYNQNFLPTFQIILNDDVIDLELQLFKSSDKNTAIWSRWVPIDVCRSSQPPVQRLMAMRKDFIEGVNVSVIGSLLDDLLQIRVLNDSEVEAVKQGETCTSAKARNLIDMVRKKGSEASKALLSKLEKRDPMFYKSLETV